MPLVVTAVNSVAMTNRTRTDVLLLAGFCAFLFFYGIGQFGLIGADEPRYAQVAREMLERHDWVTPTLGGQRLAREASVVLLAGDAGLLVIRRERRRGANSLGVRCHFAGDRRLSLLS